MIRFKLLVKTALISCNRCHGMGVLELPNGDTKECHICNGKGYIR